jgi:oligosaccharide repeat unit polymerase
MLKNKPLGIVVSWWIVWLIIANQSLTGFYTLRENTNIIFILHLISILFGAIVYALLFNRRSIFSREILNVNRTALLIKTLIIVFACVIIHVVFSLYNSRDLLSPVTYRSIVYSSDSPLYSNKYVEIFYSWVLRPLFLSCLFIGGACFVLYNTKRVLLIGVVFLLFISIVEFGRFGFYIIIVNGFFILIIGKNKIKSIYLVGALSICLILIVYVSKLRDSGDVNLIDLVYEEYVLKYHTIAFTIFDLDLNDSSSKLHDFTFGWSSILSIFDPMVVLFRVFGFDVLPQSGVMAKSLDEVRQIGETFDGSKITANAFGSNLYGLYRDGGSLFVCIFGFIYGYLFQKFNSGRTHFTNAAFNASFFYVGIFGIFMPLIQFQWLMANVYVYVYRLFFIRKLRDK